MALCRRPVSRRPSHSLRPSLRRVLLAVATVAAAALSAAAPAGAVNATLGGNYFGFEPRHAAAPATTGNVTYHGGPVMHSNNTYAIYWDPPTPSAVTGSYDGDWRALIDGFLRDVGQDSGSTGNVFALTSQYTDAGGRAAYSSAFRGAYGDTQAYPAASCTVGVSSGGVCVTDAQIRSELTRFIGANGLPEGMDKLYFVLTPPGVTVCTDSSGTDCSSSSTPTNFCSYHSFIGNQSTPGPSTVLYAVQPWTAGTAALDGVWDGLSTSLATDCQDGSANQEEPNQVAGGRDLDGDYDGGLADLIINEISVEQVDAITNPLLNGWYDSGNNTEQSDQCRDEFIPAVQSGSPSQLLTGAYMFFNQTINGGKYYLNDQFNLAAMKLDYPGIPCMQGVRLTAQFTVPANVNPGDVVGFDGSESLADMGPATYSWNFGDGSPAGTAASVFHAFTTPGSYDVTLTITDKGGNVSTATRQIVVNGAPPAQGTGSGTGSGSGSGSGSGGAAGSGGGVTVTTTTTPSSTPAATSAPSSGGSSNGPGATTSGLAAKAPAATALILSRSLAGARRSGVTVAYSVNQAVAGRFDVMIDAARAKRLHIKGAHVAGGPAGSSGSVIIGSALLATQKAGAAKLVIRLNKSAASHLGRTHNLKITVKLTVANERGQRIAVVAAMALH